MVISLCLGMGIGMGLGIVGDMDLGVGFRKCWYEFEYRVVFIHVVLY